MENTAISHINNWPRLNSFKKEFVNRIDSFLIFDNGQCFFFKMIDKRYYVCGIKILYWLGHSISNDKAVLPQEVTNIHRLNVIDAKAGEEHIVLLNDNGDVWWCGNADHWGQRLGRRWRESVFTKVDTLKPTKQIACGKNHILGLTYDGQLFSWGDNVQLGIGSFTGLESYPKMLSEFAKNYVIKVGCGSDYSIALTSSGELYYWGEHSQPTSNRPKKLVFTEREFLNLNEEYSTLNMTEVSRTCKDFACGQFHTLFLVTNGDLYVLGSNLSGQLGTYNSIFQSHETIKIKMNEPISAISAHHSYDFSMAFGQSGKLYYWGTIRDRTIRKPQKSDLHFSTFADAYGHLLVSLITPNLTTLQHDSESAQIIMNQLSRNFDCPEFSDLVFEVQGRDIHVHKAFLRMVSSECFAKMISNQWCQHSRVLIKSFQYDIFYAYLKYLYTGQIEIAEETIYETMDLAKCYIDHRLMNECKKFIASHLYVDNCCQYYSLAVGYDLDDLQQEIIQFISDNYDNVSRSQYFADLPSDTFKKLVLGIVVLSSPSRERSEDVRGFNGREESSITSFQELSSAELFKRLQSYLSNE